MKVDIREHAEFSKYLRAGLEKSVHKAILGTATRIVQHINADIIPNTQPFQPVDRGIYRAGFKVLRQGPKNVFIVNTVPHAKFIEFGVRPANVKIGRDMITALTSWVKRKGLGASSSIKTKKVRKASTSEATSMAWAIAMNMKKKGIFAGTGKGIFGHSGLQVLQRAMFKFDTFFRKEMKDALSENLK